MRDQNYSCYILANNLNCCTYVGITNDFHHRFRAHSGLIKGGALRTKMLAEHGRWFPVAQILGFPNKTTVLQFEYCMKQKMTKYRNKELDLARRKRLNEMANQCETKCSRINVLLQCLSLTQWSSRAESAAAPVPLTVVWYTERYRPPSFQSEFLIENPHINEIIHPGIINDHTVQIYGHDSLISKPFSS